MNLKSWKSHPLSVSVIRFWLGATWIYAGWNKATDPGFLNKSSAHYIGAQLTGYLSSSPISFLLKHMIEHATLFGWVVIISEFAIGIATLSGVALSLAAIGGASMSLILWLSATWTVNPYFLGSDSVYFVMWVALFLSFRSIKSERLIPRFTERRNFIKLSTTGLLAVFAALVGSRFQSPSTSGASATATGSAIAKLSDIAVGQSLNFQSADGTPAVLFRTKSGVFAYSRVCTHQGCSVEFKSKTSTLSCPCHGAQFDPAQGGAVIQGPARQPLPKINIQVNGDSIELA
ncbi:MAG: TQO small subunit DoxD [Actinomycetes bacterium]